LFSSTDTQVIAVTGRIQILEAGDLLIAAVRTTDAGKYTCVRSNEAGKLDASAYLTVLGNLFIFYHRTIAYFKLY
jgi:protein sidekick